MEQQNLSLSHPEKSTLAAFCNTIVSVDQVHSAATLSSSLRAQVLRLPLLYDCQHILMHGYYTQMMTVHVQT